METGPSSHHFLLASRLGSNNILLLVPGREGSPMTSFDAETDFKPIIIIIIIIIVGTLGCT